MKNGLSDDRDFYAFLEGYNSSGQKKLWNYFLALSKTDEFQSMISDLRKKHKIRPSKNATGGRIAPSLLKPELTKFCKKYGLHVIDWFMTIEDYLYKNKLESAGGIVGRDLCMLVDVISEKNDPFSPEVQDADDFVFPISIKISNHATLNDILNFVKINYPLIEHFRSRHKTKASKIGSFRGRAMSARNSFIFKHRQLPRKEISDLVYEKYEQRLEVEYIRSIISREKRARQGL